MGYSCALPHFEIIKQKRIKIDLLNIGLINELKIANNSLLNPDVGVIKN